MGDQIEMSLDDIIRANKMAFPRGGRGAGRRYSDTRYATGGRGGSGAGGWFSYGRTGSFVRGGNRGGISKSAHYYGRGDVNSVWQHDNRFINFGEWNSRTNVTKFVPADTTGPTKLLISNLDFGVCGTDIRMLFSECGSLKSAAIHYDRSGRSLGTADVVFQRRADAWKAINQYNGVPLDGKPMNVKLATSELAHTSLGNDLRRGIGGNSSDGGPVWGNIYRGGAYRYHSFGSSRGYVRRSWGRTWTREGYGAGRGRRPVPTAEELDAELDAYVNEVQY